MDVHRRLGLSMSPNCGDEEELTKVENVNNTWAQLFGLVDGNYKTNAGRFARLGVWLSLFRG